MAKLPHWFSCLTDSKGINLEYDTTLPWTRGPRLFGNLFERHTGWFLKNESKGKLGLKSEENDRR